MSDQALPCIVCGKSLSNYAPEAVSNQPTDGVAFSSQGHYGTTVFDPMDHSYIEINVCDGCLTEAGEKGQVIAARNYIPVFCDGWFVGKAPANYAPVSWQKGLALDGKELQLDPEEVGNEDLYPEINWDTRGVRSFREMLERERSR